ncbi:hypothetical protein PH5382_03037 [Phaeobacter sp. CECT 5382]|nr:hypothetical protein PH5382_03037 [Phaeobacter sp. CECT 5382]
MTQNSETAWLHDIVSNLHEPKSMRAFCQRCPPENKEKAVFPIQNQYPTPRTRAAVGDNVSFRQSRDTDIFLSWL